MCEVSIILPVYRVEDYIGDCIKSIINQTFKDFEVVIVDDGSPDKSIEIAEKMLCNTNIEYKVIRRKNGGLSAARNTGIENSKGNYLCFIDSDDVIIPEYIDSLYSDLKEHNCDMAIGSVKHVDSQHKFDFDHRKIKGKVVNKRDFLTRALKRKFIYYFGCFLISKRFINDNNLRFDESVFFGVDQAYMWRLMVGVDKYTFSEKQVYNYCLRPNSIMTGTKISKMLTGLPSMKKCAEDLRDNPYVKIKGIVVAWKLSVLHTISHSFGFEDFEKALSMFDFIPSECLQHPNFKYKLFFFLSLLNKRLFYTVLRIV